MQVNYLGMRDHMRFATALAVKKIIILTLLILGLIGCSDSTVDRLENITGSKLPHNIITIADIERWVEPTGNGYKIKVFEVENGTNWINYDECMAHGLDIGKYEDINLSVEQVRTYIDISSTLCYKALQSKQELELVILQEKVIFYFFNDF